MRASNSQHLANLRAENEMLRRQLRASGVDLQASSSTRRSAGSTFSARENRMQSSNRMRSFGNSSGGLTTGMTHMQMVDEARARIAHNKQRAKMRSLLASTSDDGKTVSHSDLILAAKLAKMPLPNGLFKEHPPFSSRHIVKRSPSGEPEQIEWKAFCRDIGFPQVKDPALAADMYREREAARHRRKMAAAQARDEVAREAAAAEAAAAANEAANAANDGAKTVLDLRPGVTAADLRMAQKFLRDRIETKYKRITDAFKAHDTTRDGQLERDEVKEMLYNFNCAHISEPVIDTLIDFVDFDGDGQVKYSEFARVLTADDVMNMKPTLTAVANAPRLGRGDTIIHGHQQVQATSTAAPNRNHPSHRSINLMRHY